MHKAPAVDYPVGLSRFMSLALLALWFFVAVIYAAWWLQLDRIGWQHVLSIVVTLIAAGVSLRAWRSSSVGKLQWDGQSWWWETGKVRASGEIKPRLVLQGVMLLEFSGHSRSRHWLWLQQRAAPLRWNALRRAVRAPVQKDDGAPENGLPPTEQSQQGGLVRW